jgi:hypothetical protein
VGALDMIGGGVGFCVAPFFLIGLCDGLCVAGFVGLSVVGGALVGGRAGAFVGTFTGAFVGGRTGTSVVAVGVAVIGRCLVGDGFAATATGATAATGENGTVIGTAPGAATYL